MIVLSRQMSDRSRFYFVFFNSFFFLFTNLKVCEVKYCSSCRFIGATISTSRICFFKRRLTLLTTTVTLFFVMYKKKERRKTTDNDLPLLRLSLIKLCCETSTAPLIVHIYFHQKISSYIQTIKTTVK